MKFKSVFAVVSDPAVAEPALKVAAGIAVRQDGHLDVLAIGAESAQVGYSYIGTGVAITDWSMQQAEDDAKAAAERAEMILAGQDAALRWSLETAVTVTSGVTSLVAAQAAFADLVVQPAPTAKALGELAEAVIEAALFQGHAPVLIIPPHADLVAATSPRRIILAWNQSAEALRAAKAALPFLLTADVVDLTVVDPPITGAERSDPGGPLCQFLARHGVKVEVTVLARSLARVADVLAQHAMDKSADMMVMGAYGHSRLREAVLGGATRDVLLSTRIPVLMAH